MPEVPGVTPRPEAVVKNSLLAPPRSVTPVRSRWAVLPVKVTPVKVREFEPAPDILIEVGPVTVRAPADSAVVLPTNSRTPPAMLKAAESERRLLLFVTLLSNRSVPWPFSVTGPAVHAPLAPPNRVRPRLSVSVPVAVAAALSVKVPEPP